jgi:hypothetical protein
MATVLDEPDVRDALEHLAVRSVGATLPPPGDGSNLEPFISVEVAVCEGFGFTRADLRSLLRNAAADAANGLPKGVEGVHPADMLKRNLVRLHALQMDELRTAKDLGRKSKKNRKGYLRKGRAKITGGAAVMIADATLLPVAAPASFVAGVLAIAAGIDDQLE